MIWSGLLIYWANDVYRIGFGGFSLIHLFPDWFYNLLGIDQRLAEGMAWHFVFMWVFAINGFAYVLYTAVSGEWRFLIPKRNTLREAIQVTLYDLRLSKTHPPRRKFNGAQQIAYTSIVLMGAGSLITGVAIWKPVQFEWLTRLLGGYQAARLEHFLLMLGYVGFFGIHIAQVIRAGWNNMRAMVTGYEVVTVEEEPISDLVEGSDESRSASRTRDSLQDASQLCGGRSGRAGRRRRMGMAAVTPAR